MNRLKLAVLALVAALAAATGASGCSSPASYPAPASYTVSFMGTCYVGVIYSGDEAAMFPGVAPTCIRQVFPANQPVMGGIEWALWTQLLTYDSWYHSGLYYDNILYPMSTRYHVTIVGRTSFTSVSHDFDTRNASVIKTTSAKAKWSNGKTGAYKFPTSNTKAKNKPITNYGSGAGTDNSNTAKSGGKTGTAPKAPAVKPAKPAAPRRH